MTQAPDTADLETGAVIDIPLNKLTRSPHNARRTPHGEAAIEALAASIAAKGLLQALVVEPARDAEGAPTGLWWVTIGEGRRQALSLLARRKAVAKATPVRCVIDLVHDAHEISLDENITRTDMHPADQFEAFRRLSLERGLGAEDIAARFGVSAQVVRQRLRLGAVSPRLIDLYRGGGLTLDQLMAFAVSDDHARQEQVHDQLTWNRCAAAIRRAMTEAKVPADDRRAVFVGAEAYAAAGGRILRDLFTEDGGGWFEDVDLLDQMALDKLAAQAEAVRAQEGWLWAQAGLDYPHGHGLRRVYPRPIEPTPETRAQMAALAEEYDALVAQWAEVEDLPPDVEARLKTIDAALDAYGQGMAFAPEDIACAGLIAVLAPDGAARIERGLVRPQDEPTSPERAGEGANDIGPEAPPAEGATSDGEAAADAAEGEDADAALSERLRLELSAYRTAGLREAVGRDPALARLALVHALALRVFHPPHAQASCLDVKLLSAALEGVASGLADSPAARLLADRHAAWAQRLPRAPEALWSALIGWPSEDLDALLAYCVSLGLNALQSPFDRRPQAWAQADQLALAADLDMTTTWSATAASYFGRVTKARILAAVEEACGPEAAARIADLKKPEMAQAAEDLMRDKGWLPQLLRTAPSQAEPRQDA